jgi:hypothetical protein
MRPSAPTGRVGRVRYQASAQYLAGWRRLYRNVPQGNTLSSAAPYLTAMPTPKDNLPPTKDGPPVTEPKNWKPNENEIDIDDAMIEEPPEEDVENTDPQKAPSK